MAIDVVPGQRITAAMLNAFVPKYLSQSNDQTLNTTTNTNHNTFAAMAIAAGEIWEFCTCLVIGDSNASSDIKTQWTTTGTVTTGYRHIQSMGVTATAANDMSNVNLQARATASSVSHGVTASSSVLATLQEKFIVSGGNSGGTLTLQWGCVAASGNVVVKAGSHLIAHRVF